MKVDKRILGGLISLMVLILFINNGSISLWDQDEAAYAGFGYNYLKSGDWIIPKFMWSSVHRKTPLHFWNIAITYKLFGVNEFAVRLSSALAIAFTYMLVVVLGRRLFDEKIAIPASIVLGTSLLVSTYGKVALTDATLLFFTTLCAFSMLYVLKFRSYLWVLVFWISFAGALLTKGPPIIIFSGLFGVLLFIFHEQRKNLLILHLWFFFPLASIPLVYWGYLTYQQDGGAFIRWFIDWYILKRVDGHVFGQTGPPGYHLLFFFLFFISYFMFLPKAIYSGVTWFKNKSEDIIMLGSWFLAGWLFYELTPSKLPAYAIAAHVPLSFLIAKQFTKIDELNFGETKFRVAVSFHFVFNYIISIGIFALPFFVDVPNQFVFFFVAIIHFVGNSINLFFIKRKKNNELVYSLMITAMLFLLMAWGILVPKLDFLKDGSKRVAGIIQENIKKDAICVIGNQTGHPPSLPFYIGQHLDTVIAEHKWDSLMYYYKRPEPCVLVLNKDQKKWFAWELENPKFEQILSKMTDRTNVAEYYILYNKSAALKNEYGD